MTFLSIMSVVVFFIIVASVLLAYAIDTGKIAYVKSVSRDMKSKSFHLTFGERVYVSAVVYAVEKNSK